MRKISKSKFLLAYSILTGLILFGCNSNGPIDMETLVNRLVSDSNKSHKVYLESQFTHQFSFRPNKAVSISQAPLDLVQFNKSLERCSIGELALKDFKQSDRFNATIELEAKISKSGKPVRMASRLHLEAFINHLDGTLLLMKIEDLEPIDRDALTLSEILLD